MVEQSSKTARRAGSTPQLRRAIGFIHENSGRNISVADIAVAVGVSVRALQYMFRRQLGTTPLAYLRQVRLERAHEDLQQADPAVTTVQDIATRWRFSHAGRFSVAYRQAYGASPSDTLRG
ncbi:helix-turn-helix transcriptional regulator [Mycolicibacterium thermoresistibile]